MSTSAAADGKQRSNSAAHTRTHAYQQHRHKHTRHLQQNTRVKPGYKQHVLHTQSPMAHLLHRHRQPSSTIASFSIKAAHDHCHNTLLLHVPRCRHNTVRTIRLLKSHGAKRIFYCCLILSVEKLHFPAAPQIRWRAERAAHWPDGVKSPIKNISSLR